MSHATSLIIATRPEPEVLLLTLNRPAQRNALNCELLRQVAARLVEVQNDVTVRCVVVTGGDRVFSAGADIKEMLADGFAAIDNHARRIAWRTIERFPKPMIAAVRGICFGGGLEFAMLSDIIIAAESAIFGQPEITIGIIPGDGATQRLTRVVGKALAMKMILSGQSIGGREAYHAGLVAETLPDVQVLERALALAKTISSRAPLAAQLAKESILAAYDTTLTTGLEVERRAIRYAFTTEDQKEGMAAFVEKRPAVFKGC